MKIVILFKYLWLKPLYYFQAKNNNFLIFLRIFALTLLIKSLYRRFIGVGGLREEMPVVLQPKKCVVAKGQRPSKSPSGVKQGRRTADD